MDPIYRAELTLLQSIFRNQPAVLPPDTDWKALIRELRSQTVFGLVSGSCALSVPADLQAYFKSCTKRQSAFFYRYLYAQEQLLALLKEARIPTVILKGTAAAVSYPHPEHRVMGDIDFLVPPERYEEAYELLRQNGYQLTHAVDENPKHIVLRKNGCSFELHRSFGVTRDKAKNRYMESLLRDGMAHAVTGDCLGSTFPMLPPAENGIVLLVHAAQHLNTGLGLRQIIDWMLYAQAYMTDALWESTFHDAAGRLGVDKLAVVMTRMCQLHLGLPDQQNWCRVPDSPQIDSLAEELMDYVLSGGNFGRKQEETAKNVQNHLAGIQNPAGILRQMQKSGLFHHPVLRRHRLLRPFAWIFGGAHFLREAFVREKALQNLKDENAKARKNRTLLQKLEIWDGM